MSKKETTDNGAGTAQASGQAAPAPMASPFGDLDQVRQILFGAESQEIQQRFANLEKHFSDVIDALRASVDERFKAMEASVKKQNDALSKRLNNEKEQRKEADAGLTASLKENRGQLDDIIAETERALRASLEEEADKASNDRNARFEALTARLEQTAADLGDAKTDRHSLADLLDQLSAGLRNSH